MSSEMKRQGVGLLVSALLSSTVKSDQTRSVFYSAYDIGSQYGYALPHSRAQELEADRYGLTYAALGGYDPRAAITFWERMKAASAGQSPPEFLSTHPAEENRIKQIQDLMPEALKYYKPSGK